LRHFLINTAKFQPSTRALSLKFVVYQPASWACQDEYF